VVPEIVEGTSGLIVGDRNYHSPKTTEELAGMGIELLAPYSSKKRDPAPQRSALLSRFRYRIDSVFSQLSGRYSIKRVWARDLWHLTSRVLCAKSSLTPWLSCSTIGAATHPCNWRSSSTKTCTLG
jgi:hypothetical protein